MNANASAVLNEQDSGTQGFYSPYVSTYNVEVLKHQNLTNGPNDLNFIDPTPSIMFKFNQLMLRAAANASSMSDIAHRVDPGVAINQTVSAQPTLTQNVFRSDLRWFAGAAVFEIVTVLLILPMFWGWWSLGCRLNLSPFGLTLAFDSPILEDVNSGAGAIGVVRQLGSMRLKFGEVVSDLSAFPDGEKNDGSATGRLGIAQSQNVVRPRKGVQFSS